MPRIRVERKVQLANVNNSLTDVDDVVWAGDEGAADNCGKVSEPGGALPPPRLLLSPLRGPGQEQEGQARSEYSSISDSERSDN
jgi:hypothetical protein